MAKKDKEFKGPQPGFGGLFRNTYKEKENHPDYKGSIALDDDLIDAAEADGMLELSAWKKEDKNGNVFLSISVKEKYKKDEDKSSKKKPKKKKKEVDDDDVLDDDDGEL